MSTRIRRRCLSAVTSWMHVTCIQRISATLPLPQKWWRNRAIPRSLRSALKNVPSTIIWKFWHPAFPMLYRISHSYLHHQGYGSGRGRICHLRHALHPERTRQSEPYSEQVLLIRSGYGQDRKPTDPGRQFRCYLPHRLQVKSERPQHCRFSERPVQKLPGFQAFGKCGRDGIRQRIIANCKQPAKKCRLLFLCRYHIFGASPRISVERYSDSRNCLGVTPTFLENT